MTIQELEQLAEKGFVTDVTLISACKNNPELLKTIDFSNFVSQVTSPMDVKEVEDMLKEMIETGNAKLTQSTNLSNTIIVEKELVFDLNGKTITAGLFAYDNNKVEEGDTDSYVFLVKKGGKLTINGNGNVKTQSADYAIAVWAQGGEVEINGGVYENFGEGSDLIYASAGGKIVINGGEFKANAKQDGVPGTQEIHSALNIKDADRKTTSIVVKGGKFYGFNPADNKSENPKQSFVAEGYESVETSEGVFEVREKVVEPEVPEVVEPEVADSPVIVEEKAEE